MQNEQNGQDLLNFETNYVRAESGKRFLNYIIDLVLFYILIFCAGIIIGLISPETLDSLDDDSASFGLMDRIVTLIFYAIYMSAIEVIFKGKSLGKLITKTRAVNLDGTQISTQTAFARGFSRAVPFCAFSAFGSPCNPWQDKWTNTMVVEEQKYKIV